MNPATARASRAPKLPVRIDLRDAALVPRLLALSDDDLRRRWERIAQGVFA